MIKVTYKDGKLEEFPTHDTFDFGETFGELTDSNEDHERILIALDTIAKIEE